MKSPKTILITGASSGIGSALAKAYANKGIMLVLLGRNKKRLKHVESIVRKKGAKATSHHMVDVTNAKKITNLIKEIDKETPIDLVIANAGISAGTGGRKGITDGETTKQSDRIFDVNVTGVLNTVHPLIPLMKKRKSGQIAIVSSLASFKALPGAPSYAASKAAVRFYGEALRVDLKSSNIQVSVICPGFIKTPMTEVNSFPMPMIMEADKAAGIIKRRLSKNHGRIAFPLPMYFGVWFLSTLPTWLTDFVMAKLPKKGAS